MTHAGVSMARELLTPRLLLRDPRPGDAALVFNRWARDAQVLRYLGWRPHADVAATHRMLDWDSARWFKGTASSWLVVHGEDGPVGQVQLVAQSFELPLFHWRLGYLLARSHQGRGLMREAVAAVLDHAFAQPALWRGDALCAVDNAASARLLQTLGLRREGILKAHTLHPNLSEVPRDMWVYARTREAV